MKEGRNYLSIALCSILLATTALYASETEELDSVTVTDTTVSNYQTIGKVNINRTNIDLEDTARSIQIYNEDFLFDYQPQSLTDIVTMSSNTVFGGDNHGRNNVYMMRGFSNVPILRDGFNLGQDYTIANSELYNFESVEVLKGPASLQYGEANPGGLINLVKKKPTKDAVANIELEVTSDPSVSPKVDLGGSLNGDGSLRYRLVSSYRHKEDYRDFNVDHERTFIAPSIAYDINENNTLTFMFEYLDETTPTDFGTYIGTDGEAITDRDTITTHPDQEFEKTQYLTGFDLESNYETWNSSFRYRYVDLSRDNDSVYSPRTYSSTEITRYFSTQHYDSNEHIAQYTINKEFDLGNFRNRLSLGLDAKRTKALNYGYYDVTIPYILSLPNGSYSSNTSLSDHSSAYKYTDTKSIIKSYGGFIQDHIDLTDNIIFSMGLRYQKIKTKHTDNNTSVTQNHNKSASTPQFGIIYKITPKTSLYANYAETFNSQDTKYLDINNNLLDPEEGKGVEVGVKQKLFNDNFTLTAAAFRINKKNVAKLVSNSPIYYDTAEKMISKGFELDFSGKITPKWSIMASYGYTRSEDYDNDKQQFSGVPKHTANLFTTYDLADLGLNNFYVGGGARYIGDRYAYPSNAVAKIDSDIIYNAMMGYKKDNWRVNLTVKNLTDEKYVETSGTSNAAYGQRRTGILTVSYSF